MHTDAAGMHMIKIIVKIAQLNLCAPKILHSHSVTLLQGAGLFDRLQEACTRGVAAADEGCMTVAQLKEPEGSQTLQPRLLVVCCPAGLGLDPIMQALLEGYPNSLCRVVSHTSRVPLVSYFNLGR